MTDRYTGPIRNGLQNAPPILGPGGVTGRAQGAAPAQTNEMMGQWGAEAGRLARRARYAPVLPQANDAPDYPIGPGAIASAPASQRAAAATGVPERFISSLVGQESGGDTDAQAPTSSASGSGQFTNQTWFNLLAPNAERYGHPEITGAFTRDREGNYKPTQEMREPLLDLRNDPTWSALMIGESARENDLSMRRNMGRDLTQGEIYLSHWLGPSEATTFLQSYDRARRSGSGRGQIARDVVSPTTYQANMPVFWSPDARFRLEGEGRGKRFVHEGGGRLRSVTEVYHAQTGGFGSAPFVVQDRATR